MELLSPRMRGLKDGADRVRLVDDQVAFPAYAGVERFISKFPSVCTKLLSPRMRGLKDRSRQRPGDPGAVAFPAYAGVERRGRE